MPAAGGTGWPRCASGWARASPPSWRTQRPTDSSQAAPSGPGCPFTLELRAMASGHLPSRPPRRRAGGTWLSAVEVVHDRGHAAQRGDADAHALEAAVLHVAPMPAARALLRLHGAMGPEHHLLGRGAAPAAAHVLADVGVP